MDFEFTEEQLKLKEKVKNFVDEEVIPNIAQYDRKEEFPWEIMQKAFDLGIMNVRIPSEYGGKGLGLLDEVIVIEEVAIGCVGLATSMNVNSLGFEPIILAGNKEQKEKYLRPLTEKLKFVAFALSEYVAGSDAAGIQCKAEKKGDKYIINGSKFWITNASVSDYFVVFTKTGEDRWKKKHLTAFIVEKDWTGVKVPPPMKKLGLRVSPTCAINFKDVEVPIENMLGSEGEGFQIAMDTFNASRPAIGAFGIGLARAALKYSIKYANERKAFTTPIKNFQLIQKLIADMVVGIEAAKLLTYKASVAIDNGKPDRTLSSCAKLLGSKVASDAAREVIQIWGGRGFLSNNPVEKLYRDAKILEIYEGTSQIQEIIIGNNALNGIYNP
ncbi:MAG: acyl-CoA dehydrogenase family protein [Candidatus Helarchaeota archaeon]|nr:acyl-CoA dehydrogenase family protein [Candidatus Helarchaeota archaeon]